MKPDKSANESASPDSDVSELGTAPWTAGLTLEQREVVCAAASPEFSSWSEDNFPELTEADRREVALGAIKAVQVALNDGKPRTRKKLFKALQWQFGFIEAEQRFADIRPSELKREGEDWRHFFEAPHWRWVGERFFRNRDRIQDLDDVTNDPRFHRACTDVWLAYRQSKHACYPPALLDKLLRIYGAKLAIEDLDRGRRVTDLRTEPLEADFSSSDEASDACAEEGVYPDAIRSAIEQDHLDDPDSEDPTRTPYADTAQAIDACLAKLTRRQAAVLQATMEGMPSKQIAAMMNTTVSTVDNTRRQARERLIALLIQTVGLARFWADLPAHWRTTQVQEKLLLAAAARRRRAKPSG